MARRELRDRQITVYCKSHADLVRWRELAAPHSLNNWILNMVERGIDGPVFTSANSDEVNALRKEIADLKQRNNALAAQLAKIKDSIVKPHLDKDVVALLKHGGTWSADRIAQEMDLKHLTEITNEIHVNIFQRVDSVNATIEQLEHLGLVEISSEGWTWKS